MIALDSSFLIAFKVRNDVHHEKSSALMKEVASEVFGKPFITDYIFDETVTGIFVRSKNLKLAIEYGNELLTSLEIFEIDEEAFREAWRTFSGQRSSELSFTDSTTVAVMNMYHVSRIATFDGDFGDVRGISVIGSD
ncbi:MAG: type II toxin-antitoxin system VapC family toxin [Nitrososphaerales archaeon]